MVQHLHFKLAESANGDTLFYPKKSSLQAAAFDIRATESAEVFTGRVTRVRCGFHMALPREHAGLICPRSGIAAEFGISVVNAPGIIDPDYRGEVQVLLTKFDTSVKAWRFSRGTRIAQLLVIPFANLYCRIATPNEWHALTTERGEDGFGSTGLE